MQSPQSKCQNCHTHQVQNLSIEEASYNNQISLPLSNPQQNHIYIKCTKCKIIQCKQCFNYHIIEVHENAISQKSSQNQQVHQNQQNNDPLIQVICQQCQQNDSKKFCQNCQQHLCEKCSFKIHNKGKRAKHVLIDNLPFTKIQKLLFLNPIQKLDQFKNINEQFTPSNSLIIYGNQRPDFIEQFQSLEVDDINKLSMEEIQSCLNRYPLVNLISINQSDKELTTTLMSNKIQDQCKEKQAKYDLDYVIYIGGCKLKLLIRSNKGQQYSSSQELIQDEQYDKVNGDSAQNQFMNLNCLKQKDSSQISSPSSNKFLKKQSVDFSCGSKQQNQPIPQMHRLLFKKSLKMSNRSLIIQIPQSKEYKQSPIKSDRQQGFIQRNLNLLQNAMKIQKEEQDKTLTLHLDQNYNDISQSTMNILEDNSECRSMNEQSILELGLIQDPEKDTSFRIISNDQSCSVDLTNQNEYDENQTIPVSLSLLNTANISLSTDNSLRKRSKKIPIPYFQPMKTKSMQNLNNSYGYMFTQKARFKLQKKFKQLAEKGTLMVSKQKMQELNLKFDEKVTRKMKKNVCDQQIQYYALSLQTMSIQCIYWILQSIKEDKMMPSEKLILSRLKQSFNIKPAHKLWICIIKYLQSSQYFSDKQEYDRYKFLPTIFTQKFNDQMLLEYENKWPYEDQEEAVFAIQQWELFKIVLNQYFKKNKQITGGRYGCVQYVKLNGPQKLKKCSLGRLSYFVQQAINKGLIRYHKTLLIQNNDSFQKSMNPNTIQKNNNITKLLDLQKQLKILSIQVALIDIFLESGLNTEVSLAQIPLTFKKMILFEVNLLQLGFPKLKNILQTLTDKLLLSSSKSHIKYQSIKSNQKIQQLRIKLQQVMHNFITQISQIITLSMANRHNIIVQQLYNLTNEKLGFVFDFRVCNVPDFYQFLIYYCHQTINLQFINGTFVAFPKHTGYIGYQYPQYHQYQNNGYQNSFYPQPYGYANNNTPPGMSLNTNGGINPNQCCYYPQQQPHTSMNSPKNQYDNNYHQFNYGNNPGNNNYHQSNNNYYSPPPPPQNMYHQSGINNYSMANNNGNGYNNSSVQGFSHNPIQRNSQFMPANNETKVNKKYEAHKYQQQSTNNYPTNQNPSSMLPQPPPSEISTPKFNESIEYINKKQNHQNNLQNIKTLQNFKWQSYLDVITTFQDQNGQQSKGGHHFQTQSFTDYQSIYNILDDDNSQAKLSLPKTFIEKQGSCNNNQGELYISKITPIDQRSDRDDEEGDQSLGLFDESPNYKNQNKNIILNDNNKHGRKSRGQHTRVYSTTEARTKHQRMYSTTTAKN